MPFQQLPCKRSNWGWLISKERKKMAKVSCGQPGWWEWQGKGSKAAKRTKMGWKVRGVEVPYLTKA